MFVGVTVEITLNINHVVAVMGGQGFVGPGQLLPLSIGLLSFVRVCYLLFKEYVIERQQRRTERLEREQSLHGLGVIGTTARESPAPGKRKTGLVGSIKHSATINAARRNKRHRAEIWHRILTAWLPWLSCFEWWRKLGKGEFNFQLLRGGNTGTMLRREPNLAMASGSIQVKMVSSSRQRDASAAAPAPATMYSEGGHEREEVTECDGPDPEGP